MSTLVDSNVLLDVLEEDAEWMDWSAAMLAQAAEPDFYIGAHAAIAGHTLLTRDPKRYRAYFPKLRIIAP